MVEALLKWRGDIIKSAREDVVGVRVGPRLLSRACPDNTNINSIYVIFTVLDNWQDLLWCNS